MKLWGDAVAISEELLHNHPHPHPVVDSLMAFLTDSANEEYESLKSPEPEDLVGKGEGGAELPPGPGVRLAR